MHILLQTVKTHIQEKCTDKFCSFKNNSKLNFMIQAMLYSQKWLPNSGLTCLWALVTMATKLKSWLCDIQSIHCSC